MSVSKLCEELVNVGKHVEVLTTTANGDTELNVKTGVTIFLDGVPVTYFNRLIKGNNHLSPTLLFGIWKRLRLKELSHLRSIVHIHAWWNMVSVGSCLLTHLLSGKVILSPRGTLSNYSFGNRKSLAKNIFHRTIGKHMLNRCHFHVSTEKEKQDILNILSPRSICVIPNFVEFPGITFDKKPSDTARKTTVFKLLFLSRVEEKKGLDILFAALAKSAFNYHLTIAGTGDPGYIGSLETLISELGIQQDISWIGQQSNGQKFLLLAEHDLMVLPSHDESFANVVVESLSEGTPVLISSNVGLADYVRSKDLGWVYEDGSENLKIDLQHAYEQTQKRNRIRMIAPGLIASDFHEHKLLKQYVDMYSRIIADV